MSTIPLIASAADLEGAIRHAQRNPASRWYVAKKAATLGFAELIPEGWAIVSAGLPDFIKDKIDDRKGGGPDGDGDGDGDDKGSGDVAGEGDKKCSHKGCDKKAVMFGKCKAHAKSDAKGGATTAAGLPRGQGDGTMVGMDSLTAAGDFDTIHPRDRKGRFIEKMDLINIFSVTNPSVASERGTAVGTRRNERTGIDEIEVSIPRGRGFETQYVPVDRIESAPNAKARLDGKRSTDNSIPTQIAPTMRSPKAIEKDRAALAEKRRKADGMAPGAERDKANADADAFERRIDASDPSKAAKEPASVPDEGTPAPADMSDEQVLEAISRADGSTADMGALLDELDRRGLESVDEPSDLTFEATDNGDGTFTIRDSNGEEVATANDRRERDEILAEVRGTDGPPPADRAGSEQDPASDNGDGGSPVSGMNDEDITTALNDPDVRADPSRYSALVDHAVDAGWTLDGSDDKWYAPGTHPDDIADEPAPASTSTSPELRDLEERRRSWEDTFLDRLSDQHDLLEDDRADIEGSLASGDYESAEATLRAARDRAPYGSGGVYTDALDELEGLRDHSLDVEGGGGQAPAADERADGQSYGGWSAKLYDALSAKGVDPSDVDEADARDNFERGESPENYAMEFDAPPVPDAPAQPAPGVLNSDGDQAFIPSADRIAGISNNTANANGRAIIKARKDGVSSLSDQELKDAAVVAEQVDSGRMGNYYPDDNRISREAAAELARRQAIPADREARRTPSPRGEVPSEMSDEDIALAIQGERVNASTDDPAYNADRLTAFVNEQNRRAAPGPKVGDPIRRPSDGAVGRVTADDAGMASGSGKLQVEWDTPGAGGSASNKSWVDPSEIEIAGGSTPADPEAEVRDRIKVRYAGMSDADLADEYGDYAERERTGMELSPRDEYRITQLDREVEARGLNEAAARRGRAETATQPGSAPTEQDGPSGSGPAVSADEANKIASQITLMSRSANKDSVDVTEAQANERLATVLARANNGELEAAHKDMARLMTELKLGGKQRKRYREMLDRAFGGESDGINSGAVSAESTAADLRDDNPVKERLAAKAAASKSKPEEIPDQPGFYKGKLNPGDSHWDRNPDDMSLADVEKDIASIQAELTRMDGMSERAGGNRGNNVQTRRGLEQRLAELNTAAGNSSTSKYDQLSDGQIETTIESLRTLINTSNDGPGDRARLADLRRVKAAREAKRDAAPIADMDDRTLWDAKSDLNKRARTASPAELTAITARLDEMELEIRKRDIAGASPTGRPITTRHGDIDAGDVIRTDAGYFVVSDVSENIKHGEPGWDGFPSLPDGTPDPDPMRYNKWGYADQINGISVKYADRPSAGKA